MSVAIHQWTNGGEKVLLVKCVDNDGRGYGPVLVPDGDNWKESREWPESGLVRPTHWTGESDCNSGGLFGWPWGLLKGGKEPDYGGKWIVFEAAMEDVVLVEEEKAKCREASVLYFGDWWTALTFVNQGATEWITQYASGVKLAFKCCATYQSGKSCISRPSMAAS